MIVGILYLGVVGGVAGLEHHSENKKIDRDAYTDTFDPALLTQAVTLPLSMYADNGLPSYPDRFDAPAYRHVLLVRLRAFLGAGVVQAALLCLLVTGWRRLRRKNEDQVPRAARVS